MHKTSTGTIEIIKTQNGILIKSHNKSTNHEVGITIPQKLIPSFLHRWIFIGSNESIEINTKNNRIIIIITIKFKREQHIIMTLDCETWSMIESEIQDMI